MEIPEIKIAAIAISAASSKRIPCLSFPLIDGHYSI